MRCKAKMQPSSLEGLQEYSVDEWLMQPRGRPLTEVCHPLAVAAQARSMQPVVRTHHGAQPGAAECRGNRGKVVCAG